MSGFVGILVRLIGWNVAFAVAFVLLIVGTGQWGQDVLPLSLLPILGGWTLVLGARFAHARWAVYTIAALAVLLLVAGSLVLAFLGWFTKGFGNSEEAIMYGVFALLIALIGGGGVLQLLASKRRRFGEQAARR